MKSLMRIWMLAALVTLVACDGTAVVTLTATPSTDTYLTYRVGLVSVELESSSDKTRVKTLPSSTTVDLANLLNSSEVLGVAAVAKGSYTSAIITLDYSAAEIIYDNGTLNGLALSPVGPGGRALGRVELTVSLDPSGGLAVAANKSSRLALDFKLAASNQVNAAQKTVTVTPLIAGSASPIDTKQVRIRGPLISVDTTNTHYTSGVMPFDFPIVGAGQLGIGLSDATTYEINGTASSGALGLTRLAASTTGAITVALGTLTASSTTTTSTDVSFAATHVFAGSSVLGASLDRVSGVVSARSGNTLTIEDATLIDLDGANTLLPGTATVVVGANTVVTVSGQGGAQLNSAELISVGSMVYAFGTANAAGLVPNSGNLTLDASAGRVQLVPTTASGLVTVQGSGTLTLSLTSLGGRSIEAFDFIGTGTSPSTDATVGDYAVNTGLLDLTNSTVGVPVEIGGTTASFGAGPPYFTASTLLDPSTLSAELVIDYGSGTAAPFATYSASSMTLDARNASIGTRHEIQVGAQVINVVGLNSDPVVIPNWSAANMLFAIGHSVSGTVESFNTYAAFITALQADLTGSVLATAVTAVGQYTADTYSFDASSITLNLNN